MIAIRLGDELKVDPDVHRLLLDVYASELRGELEARSCARGEQYEGLPDALTWHHELGERMQVKTSDALIPLIRGRRAVLVGDDKQLPPGESRLRTLATEAGRNELIEQLNQLVGHPPQGT